MAKRNTSKIGDLFSQVAADDIQVDINDGNNSKAEKRLRELETKLGTAIIRIDDATLGFQRVRLHRSYAELPSDISESEVEDLGFALVDLGQNINFWLGDLVLWYFEKRNAKSSEDKSKVYTELEETFGKSHSVLKNAVWIAGNVPASTRVDAPLTFTHYRSIVSVIKNQDVIRQWAILAYEKGWSDRELRRRLNEAFSSTDEMLFDTKPVMQGLKRLTNLMNLSPDARLSSQQKKQYEKDLQLLKDLIESLENKLQ